MFRWSTAAAGRLCRDGRVDGGFGADVLGHEISMLSQPVTCSFYLDDDGVVKEPIEQRRGHHRVAKDVTPFGKAAIEVRIMASRS